ncbi:MAG TPA: UDP-N-acetylmuramoyl-L-alanine--D-glutamate ligase, partial [Chitinophagaceae bacterium]|nr:UDP-N-acetylmuramoyl-L-alanine--D-glutamate ligase [Chitinophagaceae bacterium]
NNYEEIRELVKEKVKAIVCLGIDNKPIVEFFSPLVHVVETRSTDEAVQAAYSLADKGDCVLLSPACASFDLFRNYEDRGEQFKVSVRAL